MAAKTVGITGPPNPLLSSSRPPLNPIARRRYSENNLGSGEGISRSDLRSTANAPRKKKRIGGVKTFWRTKLVFIELLKGFVFCYR
jgi:hypothetical protein